MLRTVIKFGLLSGLGMGLVFFLSYILLPKDPSSYGISEVIGYAGIILSLSAIFFAVRSYRENQGGGTISFGKAFLIGVLISLIAGIIVGIYTGIYIKFLDPEFTENYYNYYLESIRSSGQSEAMIQAQVQQMEGMKDLMNNGFFQGAIMTVTVLLIGLIMSAISALVMRRK